MSRAARLAIVLAALSVSLPAMAQWNGRGRLNGQVLDPASQPIPDAKITLRNVETGDGPESFTTDEKGAFAILGLRGGEWSIVVEKEGFVPSEGSLNVNEYGSNPPKTITIRPIPEDVKAREKAQQIEAWLERGNELLEQEQWAAARAEYEKALAELPAEHQVPVLRSIARTRFQEGDETGATAALQQALAQSENDVETLQLLIHLLVSQGKDDEAAEYISRLPQGAKVDLNTLLNMGIELYNQQDFDGALTRFDRVVSEYPEAADAYYYRGLVHMNRGENAAALADFERLLELQPEHPAAADVRQFIEYLSAAS